ncbi:hypothetical protein V5O48_018416, partial [Marasmius crinis-equi]
MANGQATLNFESLSRLSVKADSCGLVLTARHQYTYESELEEACTVFKTAIPDNIDVVTSGKLALVLSGHLDGSKISSDAYVKSSLGQYIVGFLRNNSAELAIEEVSNIFTGGTGHSE